MDIQKEIQKERLNRERKETHSIGRAQWLLDLVWAIKVLTRGTKRTYRSKETKGR